MNWKILSSQYLTHFPYFTARKDSCETPDGKLIPEYYVVELRPCVCALAVTKDNNAIMVRQYRHPVQEVLLEIPGGFIDKDEDPEFAIRRELMEETGYQFEHIQEVGRVAANPGILNNYTHLFLATGGEKVGDQNLDHNEEIDIQLIPLEELLLMVQNNHLHQALHVSCIMYALQKLGRLKIK